MEISGSRDKLFPDQFFAIEPRGPQNAYSE